MPHDSNFMMSKITNCEYDPSGKKPERWMQFLDEVTNGDKDLQYFNIDHDKKEIIPMIKDALKRNPEMMIFASPWSAPAWMKDNGKMENGGRLKKEYLATWALFYAKFIQEYLYFPRCRKENLSLSISSKVPFPDNFVKL